MTADCGSIGYCFSHIAGTIFENTNKPLRDWFSRGSPHSDQQEGKERHANLEHMQHEAQRSPFLSVG
jgi:hypothetical protein